MKYTFLLLFFLYSFHAFSQTFKYPARVVDGKFIYTEVVDIDSASKDELYTRAKLWFANTFKSANDVIQMDEKSNGIIVGKGVLTNEVKGFAVVTNYRYPCTIKILFKDNKYKVEVTSIGSEAIVTGSVGTPQTFVVDIDEFFTRPSNYNSDGSPKDRLATMEENCNKNFLPLLASLKAAMVKKIDGDSNW